MNKEKTPLFAQVAPAIPLKSASAQWFTYSIASDVKETLTLYSRVMVPFGKRLLPGIVVDLTTTEPPYATKVLRLLPGEGLTAAQVKFASWIADTMQGGLGYTLRLFTPPPGDLPASSRASFRLGKSTKPSVLVARLIKALTKHTVLYVESNRGKCLAAVGELIKSYWRAKQQVLLILPEKWMIESVAALFPASSAVAIVHGSLPTATQKDIWYRVKSGQIRLIIGTQKALFLPFKDLGLIILEEEQHASHKLWDQYPRLANWHAVMQLKKIYNSHLLLTSSFPSLAAWAAVQDQTIKQIGSNDVRPTVRPIASTFADRNAHYLLPEEFMKKLQGWHKAGKKVFILHGRTGSWQTVVCEACRKAVRCPDCELALMIKGTGRKASLYCHQCNFTSHLPKSCPSCKKGRLRFFGPGSETVVSAISAFINSNQVISLDSDALKKLTPKGLAKALANHSIVLATSALLRQDLPEAFDQLVWLFPESSLLYPDVRTHEKHLIELARLHDLAPQAPVTVVTRQIELIKEQLIPAVATLYPRLLKERQRLKYPPANDMVRVTVAGTTNHQAMKKGIVVRELIDTRLSQMGDAAKTIRLRGPFQSFHKKDRKKYQVHLLLLGDLKKLTVLYRGLPIDIVDLDPQRIM